MKQPPDTPQTTPWDLPIRLFHWLLVLLVIAQIVTAKLGGEWLEWHAIAGVWVLALIIFRVVWGFVGSEHARFINFVRGPRAITEAIKKLFSHESSVSENTPGHNPLGAISVLLMLLVLLVQAISGLFSNDDISMEGPLAKHVSKAISDTLTHVHHLNSKIMLALIVLHVAAIAFYYFVKKQNRLKAMIFGHNNQTEKRGLALLIVTLISIAVYFLVS